MMDEKEIRFELGAINNGLEKNAPVTSRRFWEGYRNAMCIVIGEESAKYKLCWEL